MRQICLPKKENRWPTVGVYNIVHLKFSISYRTEWYRLEDFLHWLLYQLPQSIFHLEKLLDGTTGHDEDILNKVNTVRPIEILTNLFRQDQIQPVIDKDRDYEDQCDIQNSLDSAMIVHLASSIQDWF